MTKAPHLQGVADALNDRQRAYLLAVYAEDQLKEVAHKGRVGGPPARVWRWIEYGPVGARWMDHPHTFLLRRDLEKAGLVSQGTGATWAALGRAGLVKTTYAHTGFVDRRSRRAIESLLVQMTADGRKVAHRLRECRAKVILTMNPGTIYGEVLAGWHITTTTVQGGGNAFKQEHILTNYAPGQQPTPLERAILEALDHHKGCTGTGDRKAMLTRGGRS
jgi:hypothetical protein